MIVVTNACAVRTNGPECEPTKCRIGLFMFTGNFQVTEQIGKRCPFSKTMYIQRGHGGKEVVCWCLDNVDSTNGILYVALPKMFV